MKIDARARRNATYFGKERLIERNAVCHGLGSPC